MANDRAETTPLEALTPPPWVRFCPTATATSSLLDRVRGAIRTLHYSRRTERAYVYWITRFFAYYRDRDPTGMGPDEIRSFLSHLAVGERVTASTQNQALCALVFLHRRVVGLDLGALEGLERAKPARRIPVVLTRAEVNNVLDRMNGVPQLACRVMYGAGLRLLECLSLRVKDVDFERNEITVRDGKGAKDRVTMLPAVCRQALQAHLRRVRELHANDLGQGLGRAPLPFALSSKYPRADREWGWQYVFPASSSYTDRHTGVRHRHHLHETVIQRAMADAVRRAGLAKPATPHTLRHYPESRIIPSRQLRAGSERAGAHAV